MMRLKRVFGLTLCPEDMIAIICPVWICMDGEKDTILVLCNTERRIGLR